MQQLYAPQTAVKIHDLFFVPMLSHEEIQARIASLGAALTTAYGDKNPVFISVLSGAFVFASDLIRAFKGPCEVSFVKIKSYSGTTSTGDVQTVMGLEKSLANRYVIIVEDIVDTGKTLHFFQDHLKAFEPAEVCTVALLRKEEAIIYPVEVAYVGFDIGTDFVVGYGLDYDGLGRNLASIYVLDSPPTGP